MKAVRTFSAVMALAGMVSTGALACSGSDDASGSSSGDSTSGGQQTTGGTTSSGGSSSSSGGTKQPGEGCKVAGDCQSGVCTNGMCVAPSCTDGVKNGTESDVDCGGSCSAKCASGKTCGGDADCTSNACSYAKKCVDSPSCVGQHGGNTCGNESCCTSVSVPSGPNGAFKIDKYQITAGRMRAFVTKTNGDLRSWIQQAKPKGWDSSWDDQLPTNMTEALEALGPDNKRGCNVTNQGGRTYWQPEIAGQPGEVSDFTQDVLDEKALNCVTWYMAQAVCAFDGKRLASSSEIKWIFTNGSSGQYPWSFQDTTAYNPSQQDDRINHQYNYETPNPPANMRLVGSGSGAYPLDHAFYMAPPGSFPKGVDKFGVMDAAGDMLPWVSDGPHTFVFTFSWEQHKGDLSVRQWDSSDAPDGPDGYYAIGGRCASD